MEFLLVTSIFAGVVQSGVYKCLGEGAFASKGNSYLFNAVSYIVCIAIFAVLTLTGQVSLFSIGMGLMYGIMTAMSNGYKMTALGEGPMHLTTLVTAASMIIPTMSGFVLFGESFSFAKLAAIVFLLFFIYLSLNKSDDGKKINRKWLFDCLLCFVSTGMIGILQKIHQSSVHCGETGVFLLTGFACSIVYSSAAAKKYGISVKFDVRHYVYAIVCGLCVFANHYLNLILSGIFPSWLFFPLVNAGPMILIIIMSVVIFKEKITKRQLVGIVGGIMSLICLCTVN